jgi:Ppx/GppA phosphatase family
MNYIGLLLALIIYQPTDVTIAIEVAGNGPKLIIVDETFKPSFIDTRSASPLKDAANGIMNADAMAETTVAIESLLAKAQAFAKENTWQINNEIIVASSSIAAQKNYKTLLSQIESSTGLKVYTVTAQEEARLVFHATVPTAKRTDALVVDFGSGNSRIAYMNEKTIKEHTIPLGTVTATNLMRDLDKTVFENKIRDLVKISLPKKQVVYLIGGSAWAMQCLIKTPTEGELYIPIDIAKLRALDLTSEYTKILKTENKMTRVFTLPNLHAGSQILFSILENFPADQSFIFVNNPQSWIVEYLREQAGNQ